MNDAADDYLEKALSAAFALPPDGDDLPAVAPVPVTTMPPRALTIPDRIGRYVVEGLVGRGGMGLVLRAHDDELRRSVALKVLHEHLAADAEMVERFITEARVGSGLQHPGVVPVHEMGRTADGRPYLTMKLVEGETFAKLLSARASPAADRLACLSIFEKICQVVAYAHARGVAHLDLKPANVLVGAYGEILVTDWGFVEVSPTGEAAPARGPAGRSRIVGTPAYMSPEQAQGDRPRIGCRSDVFALGAILCEILTGAPPYEGETASEILLSAARGWLDDAEARLLRTDADRDLVNLARRCLAADPEQRPEHAGAVAGEVARHLRSLDERATRLAIEAAEARTRAAAERRQRRLSSALAVAVVLVVVLASGAWLWIERAGAARAREDERVTIEITERVRLLASNAARSVEPDPAAWDEAVEVAHQGAALAGSRTLAPELHRRLMDLETETMAARDRAAADRRTIEELLSTREHIGDEREIVSRDEEYAAVFQRRDLDVDRLAAEAAAARIKASPIRVHLVSALDDWIVARRGRRDAAGAARLLTVATLADPDEWRVRVRTALAAQDRHALELLADESGRVARSPDSQMLLAMSLLSLKARDVTIRVLEDAQRRYPDAYDLHHELGSLRRDGPPGGLPEAVRQFSMALALRPTSAHALVDLGQALLQSLDFDAAAPYFVEARRVNPNYAPAVHYLGVADYKRQRFETAEKWLRESIRIDPGFAESYAVLALMFREEHRLDDAVQVLRQIVDLRPRRLDLLASLGELRGEQGFPDEAAGLLRRAVAGAPDSVRLWNALGRQLLATRPGEAEEAFRAALKRDPEFAEAWCNLGNVLVEQGKFADGRDCLQRGHELGTAQGEAWQYPSAVWLEEAEQLVDIEKRLPTVDDALTAAVQPQERMRMTRAAWCLGRQLTAARLLLEVMTAVEGRTRGTLVVRIYAGRIAASVALGGGNEPCDAAERATWRARALVWLRGAVNTLDADDLTEDERSAGPRAVAALLHHPTLAPFVDATSIAGLDPAELAAWKALFARIREVQSTIDHPASRPAGK